MAGVSTVPTLLSRTVTRIVWSPRHSMPSATRHAAEGLMDEGMTGRVRVYYGTGTTKGMKGSRII